MKGKLNPRLVALLMVLAGAAAAVAVILLGGTTTGTRLSTRGVFLMGLGGILAGVGLTQLAWPPRAAEPADRRSSWARAPLLQKVVWIVGGVVGVVAAAVAQVVLTGEY